VPKIVKMRLYLLKLFAEYCSSSFFPDTVYISRSLRVARSSICYFFLMQNPAITATLSVCGSVRQISSVLSTTTPHISTAFLLKVEAQIG